MTGEAPESNAEQPPTAPTDPGPAPATSAVAFVSYASSGASIANPLVHALEKQGLPCWIAPRDVVPVALYAPPLKPVSSRACVAHWRCSRAMLSHSAQLVPIGRGWSLFSARR